MPSVWRHETVLLIGGGPSLTETDIAYWRQRTDRTVVINNGVYMVPDADLLWFTDARWYEHHATAVQAFIARGGQVATLENYHLQGAVAGIWCVHNMGRSGFHAEPDGVMNGSCGGYAALHLAAHLGAARAVLLGYDCSVSKGTHWHGDHPAPFKNPRRSEADTWQNQFPLLAEALAARGMEVLNASRETALTCFERTCAPSV